MLSLPVLIGLRYTRAKKRSYFVSFISLSSMLGIALGVMVLITVLSVMNGFDEEIHQRFFGMAPEITITHRDGRIHSWEALQKKVSQWPGVQKVAPFVSIQALLSFEGQVQPVLVNGILPQEEEAISHLREKVLIGNLDQLSPFGMMLGKNIVEHMGIMLGDQVSLMIPEASVTPAGVIPRFKRFRTAAIFSAGAGFNFDTKLAFIDLHDAQKLMRLGQSVTGLKLKLHEVYAAPSLADQLQKELGEEYEVGSWVDQYGPFFHAIKMEKTMMFLILMLIIAVAAFNLVSSLVMIVNDKQAEIAILRTMGATPSLIVRIFMVQGLSIGCVGTLLGLASGVWLASHAASIVQGLEQLLHTQLISANIYFVDYLPSKIMISDLVQVCGFALLMSFLATLYPAWRASRTIIAEALHHE